MPYSDCKAKRKHSREYYAKRKTQVHEWLGGECVDCGSKSNLRIIYIDPLDRVDGYNISRILLNKWDRVIVEMCKCTLVCESCRRKRVSSGN
ncbi:MAG: hypothetical protein GY861_21020 [bacterium]|nr:hypothetical protein [bacterium]